MKRIFICLITVAIGLSLVSCRKSDSDTPVSSNISNFVPIEIIDTMKTDIDGDGQEDSILVNRKAEAEEFVESWQLTVNDQTYSYGFYSSLLHVYLIDWNTADKYKEIAVTATGDNDYRTTVLFRLVDGSLVHEETSGEAVFDGNKLVINDRIDLLGTWSCASEYTITDDFKFKRVSDYTIITNEEYRLKTTAIINASNENGETAEIPAGTKLRPISTDGASWVRLTDPDGNIYKIQFTAENPEALYNIQINGKNADEFFENLPFAG